MNVLIIKLKFYFIYAIYFDWIIEFSIEQTQEIINEKNDTLS